MNDFVVKLLESYEQYKEGALSHRRFKHHELMPLLDAFAAKDVTITELGQSVEGRSIRLLQLGAGPLKVLLWSQMHGHEATATMALLDMLGFLTATGDGLDEPRKQILSRFQIYVLPMLNPDGAAVFKRTNALDYDLNRDADMLQCPESRILMNCFTSIKPDFAFNLHDQKSCHRVVGSNKPATIALLAPPYNQQRSMANNRETAAKLLSHIVNVGNRFMPGHIGKYPDDYDARCFGEASQRMGAATMLIESGPYPDDPERQFARKANYVFLLSSLHLVALGGLQNINIKAYEELPDIEDDLYHLIVRNADFVVDGSHYKADIGVESEEVDVLAHTEFYTKNTIGFIGDLRDNHAHTELDATGMQLVEGKLYPRMFDRLSEVQAFNVREALEHEYTSVRLMQVPLKRVLPELPINLVATNQTGCNRLRLGGPANFLLTHNNQVQFAVVNGFLYDIAKL